MEELSKPENRKKIKDKMYCNEHSGKKLKVYCETCDQLICKDCMDFTHVKQGHSCILVKDKAKKYKELVDLKNKAMEETLTEGNAFLQQLMLTTEQLDRDAENAINKITQRKEFVAKKVLEMLDQKAESLCKKVLEIQKSKRASLDKQVKETNSYAENIKTSVQLSKKLVDQGTEEEIISSQKMMLNNASKLLTNRKEYFNAPIPDRKLRYSSSTDKEPINEEILKGLVNSLGEVYEEKKDAGNQAGKFKLNQIDPVYSPQVIQKPISVIPVQRQESRREEIKLAGSPTFTMPTSFLPPTRDTGPKGFAIGDECCSNCWSKITNKKTLDKCGHSICADCINKAFKHQKKCPICGQVYGQLIGDQPPGRMTVYHYRSISLAGYEPCGSIAITYNFDDGVQGQEHPNPGKKYYGTTRFAYLPDNEEGNKVLKLLRKAFDQKLVFTIGRSSTTGANDAITWNDIEHKTSRYGGPTRSGYPDLDYLKRVQEELAANGITE